MFIDHVIIKIKAGTGGNGIVAFRREKYEPNGGPAGGDGGRGGSVIFKVDESSRTLLDFRGNQVINASDGQDGGIKRMTGRNAEDKEVFVPQGTTVIDDETNTVIADLINPGDEVVVAFGGRGGRGNIHFASPTHPAPKLAEHGEPGETRKVRLELKLLADVGIIGFPSVGKSMLLSAITNAKPKIAEYDFTTLTPNIGMVQLSNGRDFTVADLPGIIEGAADGVGLGIEFLRHIERTRVLLHLIDVSKASVCDLYNNFLKINYELGKYDSELLKRPQIIVATKMDLPDSKAHFEKLKIKLETDTTLGTTPIIMAISSVTHEGLMPLIKKTTMLINETHDFLIKGIDDLEKNNMINIEERSDLRIDQIADSTWVISGRKLERLYMMADLDHEDGISRFSRQLRGIGVDDALREQGAKNGDSVIIDDFIFEFVE